MKCIFCKKELNENDISRENIIPKILGGEYVIHDICNDCNRSFGIDFEKKLGENSVFQFIRAFYTFRYRNSKNFVAPTLKLKQKNTVIRTDNEGHLLMFTKPNFNYSKMGIEVDQIESQENIDAMINAKINRHKSENNKEYTYEIIRDVKKLKIGEPEDFNLHLDILILNELFLKIAYEFSCICLDSKYLYDAIGILLKNSIMSEDNNFLFDNKSKIKLTCDRRKLDFCVKKVAETAHQNTINNHYGFPLIYCSNGNYIHGIELIKKNNNFFVVIELFNIFKYKICVSNDADNYNYDDGLIAKLTTGRCNGELVNKIENSFSP